MPKDATPSSTAQFSQATAKFMIGSLDVGARLDVVAQYNPKELQYDRTVPWKQHDSNTVEFGGWQGRSLSVELFFDGVETNRSVAEPLHRLEQLATVIDATDVKESKRRAHLCVACLGDFRKREADAEISQPFEVPSLKCVIESLSVKYLVWSRDGKPLRATATVKLKEAQVYEPKPHKR